MYEDTRLRAFVTLAECGSFTLAARKLGVTQPAVSRQVSELEKDLGAELIDHSSRRGVKLTPKGETVLHYAGTILRMYASLSSALESSSEVAAPSLVALDSITDARLWADDGGFFHLELIHKDK